MKRVDFVSILRTVAPALSNRDVVPILPCFCFDGKEVTAYDDVVAITAPCPIPIQGGIVGRILLDWSAACRGKVLLFEPDGDGTSVQIKSGRARVKLPLLNPETFLFKSPGKRVLGKLALAGDFLKTLKRVALSMGEDATHPWRIGVTLVLGEDRATLYSSDNLTASRGLVDLGIPKELQGTEIILPPKFVGLIGSKAGELIIGKSWIQHDNGERRLWSATIDDVQVEQYKAFFDAADDAADGAEPTSVPKGFSAALDRSLVLLSTSNEKHAVVRVSDGKMTLEVDSPLGVSRDVLKIDDHVAIRREVFLPDMVRRALPHASGIQVVPEMAIRLTGDGFDHLVSVVAEDVQEEE